MKVYAMSDIHGYLAEFETALSLVDLSGDNKLVLLGDYIHGPETYGVLDKIMDLQKRYGQDKVIALMGNHCEMALTGRWPLNSVKYDWDKDEKYLGWMLGLPKYYVEGNTVFVHAGIDEDAGEYWEDSTSENTYLWKFPEELGEIEGLEMKVVAGHIHTSNIARNPNFHEIYYDGASHYYIDGNVHKSGIIPVLMVDTETDKYYHVTEAGEWEILPYSEDF
ncbi:MAG: metallophosphoesterase family protein [Clostridia bacterium]|nr:metallophosphoesterase family protein [Clostridia bacterium]